MTDCKMIEEVIQLQVGEEAVNDCIVFRQLEYLGLDCLPSLTGFLNLCIICLNTYIHYHLQVDAEFEPLYYLFNWYRKHLISSLF